MAPPCLPPRLQEGEHRSQQAAGGRGNRRRGRAEAERRRGRRELAHPTAPQSAPDLGRPRLHRCSAVAMSRCCARFHPATRWMRGARGEEAFAGAGCGSAMRRMPCAGLKVRRSAAPPHARAPFAHWRRATKALARSPDGHGGSMPAGRVADAHHRVAQAGADRLHAFQLRFRARLARRRLMVEVEHIRVRHGAAGRPPVAVLSAQVVGAYLVLLGQRRCVEEEVRQRARRRRVRQRPWRCARGHGTHRGHNPCQAAQDLGQQFVSSPPPSFEVLSP